MILLASMSSAYPDALETVTGAGARTLTPVGLLGMLTTARA
jgi:hypothetical protein